MKAFTCVPLIFLSLLIAPMSRGETIIQRSTDGFIAFEAESVLSITNGPPTLWVVTNDATASGTKALYQAGDNGTASSSSFARYSLKFSQPGTYTLYFRWRGDTARTTQDPNGANSFRIPITFGDLDTNVANFAVSSVNNSRVPPAANSYGLWKDNITYTVTQAEVDAGTPLIFKIGTREWGMLIDRFVLSTNDALTEAEFNALSNSGTDLVVQGQNEGFLAFEAETVSRITNGPPTLWVVTNDATASGTKALYQAGDNGTASSSSFALYSLKFSQAGTYTLYFRWRGDTARTTQDPNGANSFRIPITFGDLDTNVANFSVSSVNNSRVPPAANSYGMWEDNITYTVTQAEVDAGTPLIFKIGTREWGMFIDRFVFSTNDALTEAEFNALPNSGASTRPAVVRAVGSAGLTNITITFDKALGTASTNLSNFSVSGGITVLNAVINPSTAKDIILTTSTQTQGSNYTVTINGVVDTSGNAIAPNSTVRFTAWRLSAGWVTREFYFGITGGSVANLTAAPNFPDNPNQTDVVKGFQINNQPAGDNYGARLRAFFTPTNSGVYDFFVYADDEADIFLSTDQSEGNLQFLGTALCCSSTFETGLSVPSPFSLVAGQRYLLQILYKQATGPALLGVAARLQGNPTPPNSLPILGGNLVSTFINPDLGAVTFTQQPTNTTASAGSRARFTVSATSPGGTLFYQWQRNGVDIPGATRSTYVTPVLSTSDNGNIYRVIVSVAGNSVSSANAQLTVVPGPAPAIQPYIGINFAGDGSRGMLHSNDVAGVVQQENYNNIIGNTAAAAPLVDQAGAPTPVTLSFDPAGSESTGTGEQDADRALLQRYIHNNNTPLTVTLNGVPSGTYNLIVYSVGFNFNTVYHEDISLRGAIDYPTNYVTAQHAGQYLASPGYVRMSGTNPAARPLGNYVQFDNVSPAADGSFTLLLEPQAVAPGINYLPALNGIQLTRTTTVIPQPTLTISRTSNNQVVIAWTASAAGFTLQSTTNLLSSTSWSTVAGSPTPITGAGSITNSPAGPMRFYRLAR